MLKTKYTVQDIKNQFFNQYTLLYNNEKHYFIPIRKCAEKYSFWLLKKRINSCQTKFNYFITLTFSPEEFKECQGYIIIPSQKIGNVPVQGIDRHGNQHIYQNQWIISYLDEPNIQHFDYIPLQMIQNTLLRRTLDILRKREKRRGMEKLAYMWRFERGTKGGREHYHLLIQSNLCRVCLYFLLKEVWNFGFVDVKNIYNEATLKRYVSKYFTKHTKNNNLRVMSMRRRWSFSKNCEFKEEEKESKFTYYGDIYGKETAMEYFKSGIIEFLEDYSVSFAMKIYNDILAVDDTIRYISRTPYIARYERLKNIVKRNKIKPIDKFIYKKKKLVT